MNFQFGEPNDTQNYSNHLRIALHLNHPERKKGTLYFSLLNPLELSFLVFLLIILETFGNFLLLCMIWYEKYGMDSKKRTVTNMLLSRIIFVQIFGNTFVMPLATIGLIFGVFSEYQSYYNLGSEIFSNLIFQKVLQDHKRPRMICLALPPRQKLGLILVKKVGLKFQKKMCS